MTAASWGPPNSEMSAPAANTRSPPVITTAPGGFACRSSATAFSCVSKADDSALTFGLSSVTTATPSPRRSTRTSTGSSAMRPESRRGSVERVEQTLGGRPRVGAAGEHVAVELLVRRALQQRSGALFETADHDLLELSREAPLASLLELACLLEVRAMTEHGVPQLRDALVARRHHREDGRAPVARRGHVEHLLEVAASLGDAGAVGFVDHEHVA